MRPDRFETFAVEQLAAHPAVERAAALRDAGDTTHPFGVAVQLVGGGEWRWQITSQSAPGEAYGSPEAPVEGDPAPGVAAPEVTGQWGPADADTLLAAAITGARSPELAAVRRWAPRDDDGKGPYGLTVDCHNGAVLYLRALPVPGR